ncbi:MAG: hypothetical protein E6Q97_00465 [Desulfurellales bacterium]|nr:MAG: hypothetical protein E6Q97_00465 [Desulfurellales bacterium]
MMRKDCFYIDTETIGFHGIAVLIQHAYEDGEIFIYEPWRRPVRETLSLIEQFCDSTCVFFNASFDFFHLCKLYTTFRLLPPDACPIDLPVLQVAQAERDGRDGPCLKPKNVMDLMLHSRKGEFQTLMARHDIRLTKVPTLLAHYLAQHLEKAITFDDILFSKRKDMNAPKWKVYDRIIRRRGEEGIDPEFKDIVLKFRPDRGLKQLARHCLKLNPEFHSFKDVYPVYKKKYKDLGYIPFALGCSSPDDNWALRDKQGEIEGYTWPVHVQEAVNHWAHNEEARRYANDDVKYTRMLDEYFGYPEAGDNDSVLACMVAAVRWHGFDIDVPKIQALMDEAQKVLQNAPVNINRPAEVRRYLREVMDESEAALIDKSTKKANLEKIRDSYVVKREDLIPELCRDTCENCHGTRTVLDVECPRCLGTGTEPGAEECISCCGSGCKRCSGRGFLLMGKTLAAIRAGEILRCKVAAKEVELYRKLLRAGRFHAAFNVIGTLSSRMSGAAGLNAQGIKNDALVRSAFPLKWEGMVLSGGDFDGFEVTLADAVFNDPNLRKDLLSGLMIHTVMAMELYPGKTAEQIKLSKGFKDGGDIDMYTRGKQAVFAFMYGGDETTINKKLAIPMKVARTAMANLQTKYPGIKQARDNVAIALTALQQQDSENHGKIIFKQPDEKVTTFLGFSRYFTLENKIIEALFKLAQNLPSHWYNIKGLVERRERQQTPAGAVASALYGAAFNIQSANIRAANNHLIQSPGAMITKDLQRRIWDLQPSGIGEWVVAPMNVHDEVLVVVRPDTVQAVAEVVVEVVQSYREQVPLIGMEWARSMVSWGEKGKADIGIKPHGVEGLRDGVYVPPMDMEELEWLDEQPLFQEVNPVIDTWI